MNRQRVAHTATAATGLGSIGTGAWAILAEGPVWLPIALAATALLTSALQGFTGTLRELIPQQSSDRVTAWRILSDHFTARRRDKIIERERRVRTRSTRHYDVRSIRPVYPADRDAPVPRQCGVHRRANQIEPRTEHQK